MLKMGFSGDFLTTFSPQKAPKRYYFLTKMKFRTIFWKFSRCQTKSFFNFRSQKIFSPKSQSDTLEEMLRRIHCANKKFGSSNSKVWTVTQKDFLDTPNCPKSAFFVYIYMRKTHFWQLLFNYWKNSCNRLRIRVL